MLRKDRFIRKYFTREYAMNWTSKAVAEAIAHSCISFRRSLYGDFFPHRVVSGGRAIVVSVVEAFSNSTNVALPTLQNEAIDEPLPHPYIREGQCI